MRRKQGLRVKIAYQLASDLINFCWPHGIMEYCAVKAEKAGSGQAHLSFHHSIVPIFQLLKQSADKLLTYVFIPHHQIEIAHSKLIRICQIVRCWRIVYKSEQTTPLKPIPRKIHQLMMPPVTLYAGLIRQKGRVFFPPFFCSLIVFWMS